MITATVYLLVHLGAYQVNVLERFPSQQACEEVKRDLALAGTHYLKCQRATIAVVAGERK